MKKNNYNLFETTYAYYYNDTQIVVAKNKNKIQINKEESNCVLFALFTRRNAHKHFFGFIEY